MPDGAADEDIAPCSLACVMKYSASSRVSGIERKLFWLPSPQNRSQCAVWAAQRAASPACVAELRT